MQKIQVGIDLGTTNTVVCCRQKGKLKLVKFGAKELLPSIVYIEKNPDNSSKISVGTAALKGQKDPNRFIKSSKTYIGLTGKEKKVWNIDGKEYTPTDVAEIILKEVEKKIRSLFGLADTDVIQAVITVPAYFTSNQFDETRIAGKRANLDVIRIISEPVAAAFAASEDQKGNILVVDLGGGTFDISILKVDDKFTTLAIDGERRLGGDDFDDRLVKHFCKIIEDDCSDYVSDLSSQESSGLDYETYNILMAEITKSARQAKEDLSDNPETNIVIPDILKLKDGSFYSLDYTLTREKFEELCSDLFVKILNVLKRVFENSSSISISNIDKVYLVGGSCYIPKIQQDVEDFMGINVDSTMDRATLVAFGAGKIADSWNVLSDQEERIDPFEDKFVDIISHSMGIKIEDNNYFQMLEKNSKYPTKYQKIFHNTYEGQETVLIEVYEKLDDSCEKSIQNAPECYEFYGSFELTGITPAPAGQSNIQVTFNYDISRSLFVTAEDLDNHVSKNVKLHKGEFVVNKEKYNSPTDFFLLIDVSGSMGGKRIEQAKKASKDLVEKYIDLSTHQLGIISFGNNKANVICHLTKSKAQLLNQIPELVVCGGTPTDEAVNTAVKEFKKENNNHRKAILLITDGEPDDKNATKKAIDIAKKEGIFVATIGVQNANFEYLKQLSSNLEVAFMVDDLTKMSSVFGKAIENLLKL